MRVKVLQLEAWMMNNPVVIRNIRGPGCRSAVADLRKWHVLEYGQVLWGSDERMCAVAKLVHAIGFVRGRSVAFAIP